MIGRFQPPHFAHIETIRKALDENDFVTVVVGSSMASTSIRNPFTFEERETMIKAAFSDDELKRLKVVGVEDSAYDFDDWVRRVRAAVANSGFFQIESSIRLYGHEKDASSYYLRSFPDWKFIDTYEVLLYEKRLSSTEVRQRYLEMADLDYEALLQCVPEPVLKKMYELMPTNSPRYAALYKELKFCEEYKAAWKGSPYPPTFVTVDAVVLCKGHVLMIRRGRNPGKGLLALPGGFVEQGETLKTAAIRELKEETKIDVSKEFLEYALKAIKVYDDPWRDQRGRFITHAHFFDLDTMAKFRIKEGLPTVKAGDDASAALWVSLDELERHSNRVYADHFSILKNLIKE